MDENPNLVVLSRHINFSGEGEERHWKCDECDGMHIWSLPAVAEMLPESLECEHCGSEWDIDLCAYTPIPLAASYRLVGITRMGLLMAAG